MISIHALHEESDFLPCLSSPPADISIHALHEESDTSVDVVTQVFLVISIHALHEESDQHLRPLPIRRTDFNPRSP